MPLSAIAGTHRLIHVLKDICFSSEFLAASGAANGFVLATVGLGLGHASGGTAQMKAMCKSILSSGIRRTSAVKTYGYYSN